MGEHRCRMESPSHPTAAVSRMSEPTPRRILGIDPGLQTTGYAVLEVTDRGPRVCDAGVVRSAEGRDPADMARRIRTLYDGVCEVIDEWKPAAIAVNMDSSEVAALRRDEQLELVRVTKRAVGGACPVYSGIFAGSIKDN